jgi:hypothetical protein
MVAKAVPNKLVVPYAIGNAAVKIPEVEESSIDI